MHAGESSQANAVVTTHRRKNGEAEGEGGDERWLGARVRYLQTLSVSLCQAKALRSASRTDHSQR
jgi:hypothetical protein